MIAALSTTDLWTLVAVGVLILFGAVMAVAETAITRTSRSKATALAEQGRKGAEQLVEVVNHYERYLNSIYLVVLAAQTLQAALTGVVLDALGGEWYWLFGGLFVNIVVVFVVAEAAPKTWALQHTDRAALATAPLVVLCGKLFRYVADALIWFTNVLLPGKGLRQGPFVTEEEIIALAGEAAEAGGIEESERDLIESIIDFGDTVASEIMVPRTDMVTFEDDYRVADCVEIAILNGLSRFPVYRENVDDIVGIVYAKDLMRAERDDQSDAPISTLMREPHFVPETKRVAELLREMQARKTHIAIVVDEYGGTAGLVTMEDMLEELVGDIADEFDVDEVPAERLEDGEIVVNDATLSVDDLNDDFELRLPEGDWNSLGGLVFSQLGRVPAVGDVVDVEGYQLLVEAMDGKRVGRVRIVEVPVEVGAEE